MARGDRRGLLGADVIGFHLDTCADNFLDLCRRVSGEAGSHTGLPDTLDVRGRSSVREASGAITAPDGRTVRVGSFPISIDSGDVIAKAADADRDGVRALAGDPRTLLLGVDRLDYTKGILVRLEAFSIWSGALDRRKTSWCRWPPCRAARRRQCRTGPASSTRWGASRGFGSLGRR